MNEMERLLSYYNLTGPTVALPSEWYEVLAGRKKEDFNGKIG